MTALQRTQNHEYEAWGRAARGLIQPVNTSSIGSRNSWLFFMALTAFFFIAVAGIKHKDLFLNTPVALPLLQTEISLKRFFFFGPIVYILIHFSVLLQHVMLARKMAALEAMLKVLEKGYQARTHPLRLELSDYFFTQNWCGAKRSPVITSLLRMMSWLTLGILPLLLLLYFQIKFLPYHLEELTWGHRVYVLVDFIILLVLGVFIRFPELGFWQGLKSNLVEHPLNFLTTLFVSLMILVMSWFAALVPDGRWEQSLLNIRPLCWPVELRSEGQNEKSASERSVCALTALFFEGRYKIPVLSALEMRRNLVVIDMDFVADAQWEPKEVSLRLRGRDFRYAQLDRSDLHRADFSRADLSHASLRDANLRDAKFDNATLTGTVFEGADINFEINR